jgi:hypothetical protein
MTTKTKPVRIRYSSEISPTTTIARKTIYHICRDNIASAHSYRQPYVKIQASNHSITNLVSLTEKAQIHPEIGMRRVGTPPDFTGRKPSAVELPVPIPKRVRGLKERERWNSLKNFSLCHF